MGLARSAGCLAGDAEASSHRVDGVGAVAFLCPACRHAVNVMPCRAAGRDR